MRPGMMPILAFPGEIPQGNSPMSRDFELLSLAHTFTMSSVGMPCGNAHNQRKSRVLRSRIASRQTAADKIIVAFAPVE